MSEPRTISLPTVDAGEITLPEPSWCAGHSDHQPDTHRVDITHNSSEISAALDTRHGRIRYLTAWIAQAPYSSYAPEALPLVAVDVNAETVGLDPDAVRAFTALTRAHLGILDRLADECDRLRGTAAPAVPARPEPVDVLLGMVNRLAGRLAAREAPWDQVAAGGSSSSAVEQTASGHLIRLRAAIERGEGQ